MRKFVNFWIFGTYDLLKSNLRGKRGYFGDFRDIKMQKFMSFGFRNFLTHYLLSFSAAAMENAEICKFSDFGDFRDS